MEKEKTFAEKLVIPGALIGQYVEYVNLKTIVYGDKRLIDNNYDSLLIYNERGSWVVSYKDVSEWIEPEPVKPKVKRAQALLKHTQSNAYYTSIYWHRNEEDVLNMSKNVEIIEFPFNGKWIEVDE